MHFFPSSFFAGIDGSYYSPDSKQSTHTELLALGRYLSIMNSARIRMSNAAAGHAPATIHVGGGGALSVTWKIQRERVLLLGWGRAILLQLAHPLIAAGVSEHSTFLGPGERVRRLQRTVKAMLALTFGEPYQAAQAARGINGIHDRVHGTLPEAVGSFPAGTAYSAHDPELLCWVHATLVDSFVQTYELLVGPLSDEEKDRYCAESAGMESTFGIPSGYLPRSMAELQLYMSEMFEGGRITIGRTARHLSHEILHPPFPWIVEPLLLFFRLLTAGMLPPSIRQAYGLPWSEQRGKALRVVGRLLRTALPAAPSGLRYWRGYREATSRLGS
jgi:uncharacterized protein (DUF2236 family)